MPLKKSLQQMLRKKKSEKTDEKEAIKLLLKTKQGSRRSFEGRIPKISCRTCNVNLKRITLSNA